MTVPRQRRPATGSVVIPAHNEEAVLARCLGPLAGAAADGTLEVAVVCNGCTDRTAEVARSFPGVRVVELAVGSKPAALRAGDRAVTALPRVYLDADVLLLLESVHAVLRRLGDATPAGRPPVRYDASRSTFLVRRYYAARASMPAVLGSLWGAGVYALAPAGRTRFTEFPDVVADDLWVDQLFRPAEISIVDCPPVTVTAPVRARDLLRVLRRGYRGNASLPARPTAGGTVADLARLARSGPRGCADALVYAGFAVAARLARRVRAGDGWERDDSARALATGRAS